MNKTDSLKEVERQAYRSTFDDGIYDIMFAMLFLIFAWIPVLESLGVSRFAGYPLLIIPILLPPLGKRLITNPRLGAVEFGRKRKSMRRVTLFVSAAILILMLPLLIMIVARGIPAGQGWFFVALAGAPIFALAIYATDCPRLYIYAALILAGVVESEFLRDITGTPFNDIISFGLPGLIILIIGFWLLLRFIRRYPRSAVEANHAS